MKQKPKSDLVDLQITEKSSVVKILFKLKKKSCSRNVTNENRFRSKNGVSKKTKKSTDRN